MSLDIRVRRAYQMIQRFLDGIVVAVAFEQADDINRFSAQRRLLCLVEGDAQKEIA